MIGKFIVLEGVDGSGKSTAIKWIKEYFIKNKLTAIYTHEPGGTEIAEKLKKILLYDECNENIHPYAELLMIYAGRIQHYKNVILPYLKSGINVISDRFYWSTIAYQGGGRKINLEKIKNLNDNFLESFEPDLIIYLDIDEISRIQRIKDKNNLDRIEKSGLDFFNRVRKSFKDLVINSNNAIEINATKPMLEVKKQILLLLNNYFNF